MDDFDTFWAAYPKKFSKGEARKAWAQTSGIRPPIDELLAALDRGKRSAKWHESDRQGNIGAYIPYPASWLRAEGWDNEYTIVLPPIGPPRAPVVAEPVAVLPTEEQKEEARRMLAGFKLKRVVDA